MTKRGQNEGSIYRRKNDNRWAATITLGYENGKRKRKTFYGETRKEVQEQLTKALHTLQECLPISSDRQTTGQYLEHWLVDIHRPTVREKTYGGYEYIVRAHLIPGLGRVVLARLGPRDVHEFLRAKLAAGLSARTAQYCHAVLHTTLEDALRWGHVARNVARLVRPPRVRKREIQPLTPEQAQTLLNAMRGPRLEALYTVTLAVGLREGEALGLRWSDVDLEAGTISVRAALHYEFYPLLKRAGLPPMRFHDVRHTAATLLLGKGINPKIVSELLGHASVAIMLDLYSHVLPDMQQQAAAAMDDVLAR